MKENAHLASIHSADEQAFLKIVSTIHRVMLFGLEENWGCMTLNGKMEVTLILLIGTPQSQAMMGSVLRCVVLTGTGMTILVHLPVVTVATSANGHTNLYAVLENTEMS